MDFMLGCNYWASNAGTDMWTSWDITVIEQDLKTLSNNGMKYLRVFPNWRDFQPVYALYGYKNLKREYCDINGNRFNNPYFLDMTMIKRFRQFCKIAQDYGFQLVVGILTGWMSGRTFTPPILEDKNLYTDETALLFEQRFIKGFVSETCDIENIIAWDLGNECNCLSKNFNRETSAVWTAMISNTIRAYDIHKRPILSGMHSLGVGEFLSQEIDSVWTIFDQAENVDVLTTHPYPQFVEYCFKDDMNSFRTMLHATCEGLYYSNLGKKPCLTEEMGNLGPMNCDDETAAIFLRANLYSNWANGSLGLFWWCACEQVKLKSAPYKWSMMERELGLIDVNGIPKLTLLEYSKFAKWIENFGEVLPEATVDAVCVIGDEKSWGKAYMAFLLAKQAHVNLEFVYHQQNDIPAADTYLMPSLTGDGFNAEALELILKNVKDGATLYISNDNGYLAEFESFSGVHIKNSLIANEQISMNLCGENIESHREKRFIIEQNGAEIIAYDNIGLPIFTKYSYGNGTVYYLNFPLETSMLDENYAFNQNYYMIYNYIFKNCIDNKPLTCDNKFIGITYHFKENICYAVLINYTGEEQHFNIMVKSGFELSEVYGGTTSTLSPGEAVIITLTEIL